MMMHVWTQFAIYTHTSYPWTIQDYSKNIYVTFFQSIYYWWYTIDQMKDGFYLRQFNRCFWSICISRMDKRCRTTVLPALCITFRFSSILHVIRVCLYVCVCAGPESAVNVLTNHYIRVWTAINIKTAKRCVKLSFEWPIKRNKLHKCEPRKLQQFCRLAFLFDPQAVHTFCHWHLLPTTMPSKCICTQYWYHCYYCQFKWNNSTQRQMQIDFKNGAVNWESVKSFPIKFMRGRQQRRQRRWWWSRIIQQNVENFPNKFICIRNGCTVHGLCFIIILLELELAVLGIILFG